MLTYIYSHAPILTYIGYHAVAPNGFVNGMGDELKHNEEDAYPEDGPLHSGTHSLRRIRNTTSKTPMVSLRGVLIWDLKDMSLLVRCPHFRGFDLNLKM